jgi:2'-hydroxyisoflavone reductase
MKILILGGTVFVGRHLAREALYRGHDVTLFNRGRTDPKLFPEAKKLFGDRDGTLDALNGQMWDAVIDTCGYVPRIVRQSALRLSTKANHYTFISSISVYRDFSQPGLKETSTLGHLKDKSTEEIDEDTYGPLKVLCEQEVTDSFPERALIVRPGIIVGPNDPTDRFTYWPVRVARGGSILAPRPSQAEVQFIDVRDLAEWILNSIEVRRVGAFNATGPDSRLTMGKFLGTCAAELNAEASFIWADKEFLMQSEVKEWMELPFWLADESLAGLLAVNIDKAISAGLTFRALKETVRATYEWAQTRDPAHEWRAGLKPEKETALLSAWRKYRSKD